MFNKSSRQMRNVSDDSCTRCVAGSNARRCPPAVAKGRYSNVGVSLEFRLLQSGFNVSQDSVATLVRIDGMFSGNFIANFPKSQPVKEL